MIPAIGRIQSDSVFLVGLLLYIMMQSLIDWLNQQSWRLLSTIAQSWTAPVSVLGHSWPTFSLFLPVQSSLFTLLWTEFFIPSTIQNAEGGVNNIRVTLLSLIIFVWTLRCFISFACPTNDVYHNIFKKVHFAIFLIETQDTPAVQTVAYGQLESDLNWTQYGFQTWIHTLSFIEAGKIVPLTSVAENAKVWPTP